MDQKSRLGVIAKKNSLSLEEILQKVKNSPNFGQAGDIITFTGVVRETSLISDKKVQKIEIEAADDLASNQLDQICKEMIKRHDLIDARIIHYVGEFKVGEPLVHCVVASKHRDEGFRAILDMIDSYKHQAYIWKCEKYSDGSEKWISTDDIEKKMKNNFK